MIQNATIEDLPGAVIENDWVKLLLIKQSIMRKSKTVIK